MKRTTADKWFSDFVRIRGVECGVRGPCFTCGKWVHWKYEGDCGHFQTRNKPLTRFHEQNAHLQCYECNRFKKGEQDLHGVKIDQKYGPGTAQKLRDLAGIRGGKDHAKLALKEIAKEYRLKTKAMAKEKGVEL